MATSYLYFAGDREKYEQGYDLLDRALSDEGAGIDLPLLDEAINAIQKAVMKLKSVQ